MWCGTEFSWISILEEKKLSPTNQISMVTPLCAAWLLWAGVQDCTKYKWYLLLKRLIVNSSYYNIDLGTYFDEKNTFLFTVRTEEKCTNSVCILNPKRYATDNGPWAATRRSVEKNIKVRTQKWQNAVQPDYRLL